MRRFNHRNRRNDFAISVAGFLAMMKPLLPFLKTAITAGAAAGVSKAFSVHVFEPIADKILADYKLAVQNRGKETIIKTVMSKLKQDLKRLFFVLKNERASIQSALKALVATDVSVKKDRAIARNNRMRNDSSMAYRVRMDDAYVIGYMRALNR